LVGSARKLKSVVGQMKSFPLQQTLAWMYHA
jgi:hypothetical protein